MWVPYVCVTKFKNYILLVSMLALSVLWTKASLGVGLSNYFDNDADLTSPQHKVVLLKKSRVRPSYAVRVGTTLFYGEAQQDIVCETRDLLKYDYTTQREDRILSLPCVFGIYEVNGKVFVSVGDNDQAKLEILEENRLSAPKDEAFADQMARVAAQLDLLIEQNPDKFKGDFRTYRWAVNAQGEVAVLFQTRNSEAPLVSSFFPMDGSKAPVTKIIPITGASLGALALGTEGKVLFTSLAKQASGSAAREVNLVDLVKGTVLIRFGGGEIPLPEDGSAIAAPQWKLKAPSHVKWAHEGFTVVEGEEKGGGQEYAAYVHLAGQQVSRLKIPSTDLGSVSGLESGWLVAKPRTREIVYYGSELLTDSDKIEKASEPKYFNNEALVAGQRIFFPPENLDFCSNYSLAQEAEAAYMLSYRGGDEQIYLGFIEGIVSLACNRDTIVFAAKSFKPSWARGHLEPAVLFGDLTSNVEVPKDTAVISGTKPLLFVIRQRALAWVRHSLLDTLFAAVRSGGAKDSDEPFTIWLRDGEGLLSEYRHHLDALGEKFIAAADVGGPTGKEFFERKEEPKQGNKK